LPHIFERFYTGSAGMNCTETGSLRNNTHTENDTVQCGAQIPQLQSVGIGLALSRTIISKQTEQLKRKIIGRAVQCSPYACIKAQFNNTSIG